MKPSRSVKICFTTTHTWRYQNNSTAAERNAASFNMIGNDRSVSIYTFHQIDQMRVFCTMNVSLCIVWVVLIGWYVHTFTQIDDNNPFSFRGCCWMLLRLSLLVEELCCDSGTFTFQLNSLLKASTQCDIASAHCNYLLFIIYLIFFSRVCVCVDFSIVRSVAGRLDFSAFEVYLHPDIWNCSVEKCADSAAV